MAFTQGQIPTADDFNQAFDNKLEAGLVSPYSLGVLSGGTQAAWFAALGLPAAAPGNPSGVATLDSGGTVPLAQLPGSIVGALYFHGTWDASTNTPAITSGIGTEGWFYVVTVPGATSIDGNSSWSVGDLIYFAGGLWRKINGSGNAMLPATNITDSTASGRALLTASSVAAQRVALNIDKAQLVVDWDVTITSAMQSVAWSSLSAPRVGTLPALSTMNAGQAIVVYDESGACSAANTITINPAGADTINNGGSWVLSKAYSGVVLIKASAAKWTALAFGPNPGAAWITQPQAVRQTVRAGPVDANGYPSFLPTSNVGALSLTTQNISGTTPIVATSALGEAIGLGQSDRTGLSTAALSWTGLTPSSALYLYFLVNADGTLTPGFTALAPIYQHGGTPAVTSGQFTFNIAEMRGYLGNGTTAPVTALVFVGECTTDGTGVFAALAYAYNGRYDSGFTAALPSTGTLVSKNSNLGIYPERTSLIVECTTAEGGYSVGDRALHIMTQSGAPTYISATPLCTRNTLFFKVGNSSNEWQLANKNSGGNFSPTLANWKYKVTAQRGW